MLLKGGGGIPPYFELVSVAQDRCQSFESQNLPGKPKGGGGKPWPGIGGGGPCGASMGFDPACPSAAYEFVIESMTDCAFSWPISVHLLSKSLFFLSV